MADDPNARSDFRPPVMLPLLDAMRGGLALAVLAGHCVTARVHPPAGGIWVDFFMMLSGFLMVHHAFLREKKEPVGTWKMAKTFWLRRYFRIAPLYYVLLAIVFIGWWPMVSSDPKYSPLENAFWHVTFLFGFLYDQGGPTMMPDWSIGLEMQFYMAFPVLVWVLHRFGPVALVLGGAAITCTAHQLFGVYAQDTPGPIGHYIFATFLPLRLSMFTTGMLICWLWWRKPTGGRAWALGALGVLISLIGYEHGHSLTSLTFVALLIAFRAQSYLRQTLDDALILANRISDNAFCRWAADLSYGAYLSHPLALMLLTPRITAIGLGKWTEWLLLVICTAILTYSATALLHIFIEKPAIRWGKRFVQG